MKEASSNSFNSDYNDCVLIKLSIQIYQKNKKEREREIKKEREKERQKERNKNKKKERIQTKQEEQFMDKK